MRAVLATARGAVAEAVGNPGAFWSQLLAMVLNDLSWLVFWGILFERVPSVRGWTWSDILMLQAVLTTSGGIVLGPLANARRLPELIRTGGLDAVLALPVRPLPVLLVRRVDAINVGDIAFGVALFLVAGHPTPARFATFVFVSTLAAVVFASFLVLTGSLTFFSGSSSVSDLAFNAIVMLASYPADIFGGATRALLYTALPAAFVAAVPARLLRSFDTSDALVLAASALAFATAATGAFTVGLRRYTASSLWSRA
jgi:ABC-2 type transport system permease protein